MGARLNRAERPTLRLDKSQPDAVTVNVAVLQPGSLSVATALKGTVDVTIGAARIVGLVYAERFRIMVVEDEIDQLAQHLGEVIKKPRP